MADDSEVPAWLRGEESCVGASAQAFLRRVPLVGPTGAHFSQFSLVSLPPSLSLCLCRRLSWACVCVDAILSEADRIVLT